MIRNCKWCGKPFEAHGTQAYCSDIHYSTCEICGKSFVVDPIQPRHTCSEECRAIKRKRKLKSQVHICELCGEPFVSEGNIARYCKKDHYRPCPICGKPVKIKEPSFKPSCCSKECVRALVRKINLEKYGVEVASKSEEVRAKLSKRSIETMEQRKKTNLERYGVEYVVKLPEVREKISNTVKSKECQRKIRQTMIERYGVPFSMQSPELLAKYSQTVQEKYGVPYYCMTDECKDSNGFTKSKLNSHYLELFKNCGFDVITEFNIGKRSYDFKIGDILIEINPTITHNSALNIHDKNSTGLSPDYHKNKSELAKENGYHCIHIFDWDNFDKILSLLYPKHQIYARKCRIEVLSKSVTDEFLNQYHLQNTCKGQKVRLGLFYQDELVEVMTFGKPRYNKKYEWELLRLCTKSGYQVIGGASKLFQHFIQDYNPQSIISYCDASKFNGDVYHALNMKFVRQTKPNKIWSNHSDKITNNLLIRHGYDQLFNADYGKGTSNEQLMIDHGWLPVYDCGQYVYEWKL